VGGAPPIDYHHSNESGAGTAGDGRAMLFRLLTTLVKIAVASLIVGTILAHFGITAEHLLKLVGLTPERVGELMRQALAWALPNLLLGSLIILPVWCVMALFRPPWRSLEDRYYDRYYDRDWR
jgi:hypothetical protein